MQIPSCLRQHEGFTTDEAQAILNRVLRDIPLCSEYDQRIASVTQLNILVCSLIYYFPNEINAVTLTLDQNAFSNDGYHARTAESDEPVVENGGRWGKYRRDNPVVSNGIITVPLPFNMADYGDKGISNFGSSFRQALGRSIITLEFTPGMETRKGHRPCPPALNIMIGSDTAGVLAKDIVSMKLTQVDGVNSNYSPPFDGQDAWLKHYIAFKGMLPMVGGSIYYSHELLRKEEGRLFGVVAHRRGTKTCVYSFQGYQLAPELIGHELYGHDLMERVLTAEGFQPGSTVNVYEGSAAVDFLYRNTPNMYQPRS